MARLTRKTYTVAIYNPDGGPPIEHTIETGPGDDLKAEGYGTRRGLLPEGIQARPLTFATLVIYHALVRREIYTGKWDQFIDRDLYEFDVVKGDERDVDPTISEGRPLSDSPSPATSPDSPTGPTAPTTD